MLPASLAHSVRGSMPLTFKLCQGQAETPGKDTELGPKESSAVAALFLACVQVCVHLAPSRSFGVPVCLVLCHLQASLSHNPRSSTCLSVWVSKPPCVSLCLSLFGLWVSLLSTHSQTSLPSADRMCAML